MDANKTEMLIALTKTLGQKVVGWSEREEILDLIDGGVFVERQVVRVQIEEDGEEDVEQVLYYRYSQTWQGVREEEWLTRETRAMLDKTTFAFTGMGHRFFDPVLVDGKEQTRQVKRPCKVLRHKQVYIVLETRPATAKEKEVLKENRWFWAVNF